MSELADIEAARIPAYAVAVQDRIRASLQKDGGVILVVGGRTTNFADTQRQDARITFWDSTDPDVRAPRTLPSNTRGILFTRFLPHTLYQDISQQARRRNIPILKTLSGTGEIRRMLDTILPTIPEPFGAFKHDSRHQPLVTEQAPPAEEPPVSTTQVEDVRYKTMEDVPKYKSIRELVLREGNFDVQTREESDREVARLVARARQVFPHKTFADSSVETYYVALRIQKTGVLFRAARRKTSKEKEQPTPVRSNGSGKLPSPSPLLMAPTPVVAPSTAASSTVAEALKLLGDAEAAISLAKEAVMRVASEELVQQERARRLDVARKALAALDEAL